MSVVIVDYKNLIWRASDVGKSFGPLGGVAQFLKMATKIQRVYKTHELVFAFEGQGTNWRESVFPAYKKNRDAIPETDTERAVNASDRVLQQVLPLMGARCFDGINCEGDDVIAALADHHAIVVSIDRDLWQLVNDETEVSVCCPLRGAQATGHQLFSARNAIGMLVDERAVQEHMGIAAHQIPLFKAIAGDPGDGYKGVPGVGKQTAATICNLGVGLDGVMQHLDEIVKRKTITPRVAKLLQVHEELLRTCYKIATVKRDVELVDRTDKRDDEASSRVLLQAGCTRAVRSDIFEPALEAFSWRSN